MKPQLVSIVLPIYNEAQYLVSVVEEYQVALSQVETSYEFVLVPNGCGDESPAISRDLAQKHSSVRVVESKRGAWGLAVRLGLAEARGDLLCYTNFARTTAQDLAMLIRYAIACPNVVIKVNRKIRENWRRRLGSLLYNLECRALFDLSYWDINGTPKIFPRSFAKLLCLTREDDLIDAEFNLICRREGYPMIEVPITSFRRRGGKSTTSYKSAGRLYWGAFQMWLEEHQNNQ